MSQPKAVICVSGGMDSLVATAVAAEDRALCLLHARYGQRTQSREQQAFETIAWHYGVDADHRLVIDMGHLARIGGSSLTDTRRLVEQGLAEDNTGIPTTYVPFRNANILAAGVAWAEVIGAEAVYIGVTEEDSAGYPDCRREFIDAMQKAVDLGTRPETSIRLETPLIGMSKTEIVRLGCRLGAPFALSWSCYTELESACGRCDSCRRRLRAFEQAGVVDPIPYLAKPLI